MRRELSERLGVNPSKIFAVPEAPRACFQPLAFAATEDARRRLNVGANFVLAVGTIEPRKNLSTLVRAFAEVVRHSPRTDLQLVIAGHKGWLSDALFAELKGSGVESRVVCTGYVSDEDLRALYSSCRLFVYPSIYEGFGLPPLEAMACGAPVVASRIPSLSETTGGAARLFDPQNVDELARIIIELTQDEQPRAQLTSAGRRHAAQFSWERTAKMTLEVYEEALKKAKGKRVKGR
ncbi:MAG: glycosyltransferase family 4 protein [Acidobacteria bacterium]|nr:glycosyltransferase family 4 protein [Acidobacteriota bacterium]